MKWVARCQIIDGHIFDKDLSPEFESARECADYIHENLQVLEWLLHEVQFIIDNNVDKNFVLRFGNYIRAYNKTQERFCSGFDF